jgi:hypothetical protein
VRFQVLTAASMKMAVFWVVAPCGLVGVYRRFRSAIALMIEAASTSETSVNFSQTTRRNNPEDSHLHTYSLNHKPEIHSAYITTVSLNIFYVTLAAYGLTLVSFLVCSFSDALK